MWNLYFIILNTYKDIPNGILHVILVIINIVASSDCIVTAVGHLLIIREVVIPTYILETVKNRYENSLLSWDCEGIHYVKLISIIIKKILYQFNGRDKRDGGISYNR